MITHKYLISFFMIISLLSANNVFSEECDYTKIKEEITKSGFKVTRKSNFYHNLSDEKVIAFSDRFEVPKDVIKFNGLHSLEYHFEEIDFSPNLRNHHTFVLLKFDSESNAKKVELTEKKNIHSSISNIPNNLKKSFDFSHTGIERIRNYVAVFLFGENIRKRSSTILTQIKECKSFDFENFFSKSTLSKIFTTKELQNKQVFRSTKNETKAVQDAMYTSELETKNSFNKQIEVISKKYLFNKKYHLHDELELEKVVINFENISEESFFSVDVFVIYYDKNNEIIDVVRSIAYSIEPKESFEIESRPSHINNTHATSAYVAYTISNPLSLKSN